MTEFEMLLACYRSGQISERQWQEHLRDREFREWVENQLPINCPSACSGRDIPGQEAEMPDRIIMVLESEWREVRDALKALLACPAIFYGNLDHPFWGCKESAEAETKARAALAKSEATHPTLDGCGREWKQIEAAARAIADAWGEIWECCCTEQRGLDCDCGDAMSDERDWGDERLTREDCRKAARAALSALTAGGDDG